MEVRNWQPSLAARSWPRGVSGFRHPHYVMACAPPVRDDLGAPFVTRTPKKRKTPRAFTRMLDKLVNSKVALHAEADIAVYRAIT